MPLSSLPTDLGIHAHHDSAPPVVCDTCALRRCTGFRSFSKSELQFVSGMKCCDVALAAGEDVFREGQPSPFVFTLYEGWAARALTLSDGTRQILDFVLPGDLIGLAGYLLGASPHSVRALTPIRLCALDARQLPALFRAEPSLAMALMAARMREQQRGDTRLALLGRLGACERLAYLLLELRARLRERGLFEGRSCRFPVRRLQLADAVGLSKAHLMRALRELRERGLAELARGMLTIPNARKLAQFSGYALVPSSEPSTIL